MRPVATEGTPPWQALRAHLDTLPARVPLVIHTHGLRHSPFGKGWNPHDGALSGAPTPRRHWKAHGFVRS